MEREQVVTAIRFRTRMPAIKKLLHMPWHGWMGGLPELEQAIQEVLFRIPDKDYNRFMFGGRKLVFLPQGGSAASVIELNEPCIGGVLLVLLDPVKLNEQRPREEICAIIAHELGHLSGNSGSQVVADRQASKWGFGAGLIAALRGDRKRAAKESEVDDRIKELEAIESHETLKAA